MQYAGGVCPRRILNVDRTRQRCLVAELDESRLRRVAFSVDVEIAGGPRYNDEADAGEKKKKFEENKLKEQAEGEALKHPEQVAEEKEKGEVVPASEDTAAAEPEPKTKDAVVDEKKEKKKEKKKKSEEERKARKEEKKRKAEDNGSIPMQIQREEPSGESSPSSSTPPATAVPTTDPTTPRQGDRPTTDPLRIYRRCCSLRETPVLKRISEQLAAPSNSPVATPGVVSVLNLSGSRLQLADFVTLSDWLALVPVRKLLLEDAELTDEAVRIVLAGLLAAKTPEQARQRAHQRAQEHSNGSVEGIDTLIYGGGSVEKLILKNNPRITKEGWKHIALFIYMCKSLKGLDVSMISFPQSPRPAMASPPASPEEAPAKGSEGSPDLAEIFSKSLAERLGGSVLEELVMGECQLSANQIRHIVDGVTISGLTKLGLAGNNISAEALEHVIRYLESGICQGLDLGGNDLRNHFERICEALYKAKDAKLWALSLADTNMNPKILKQLFPALLKLSNLRFLDFSHNHELFESQPSAVAYFRKYLPMFPILKRIHLRDVAISAEQAIAIAEILPECAQLAHINVYDNPKLSALASATEEEVQEEACALYASFMAAARVSHTLLCVDIDAPTPDNSEVVRALAKQVIAYCLRNLEYATQSDQSDAENIIIASKEFKLKDVEVPDVLLHIVGQSDGHVVNPDEAAPDNDYIVGGTGVVKALNYCLTEKAREWNGHSGPNSGTVTPREYHDTSGAKAMNMSISLLESAKKIRGRLEHTLVNQARAGDDDMAYRESSNPIQIAVNELTQFLLGRLLFLDNTLSGIIQRFEDEYPEVRSPSKASREKETDAASSTSSLPDTLSQSLSNSGTVTGETSVSAIGDDESDGDIKPVRHQRHVSDVSIAAKELSIEEGQVHRLGQKMKHDLWHKHGGETLGHPGEDEPEHLRALRDKLDVLDADELRDSVNQVGVEGTLQQFSERVDSFRKLQEENPAELAELRSMLREKASLQEGVETAEPVQKPEPVKAADA